MYRALGGLAIVAALVVTACTTTDTASLPASDTDPLQAVPPAAEVPIAVTGMPLPDPSADSYFRTIAGYTYVALPPESEAQLRTALRTPQIAQYFPTAKASLVNHVGDPGLLLLVMATTQSYATLPGLLDGVSSGVGTTTVPTTVSSLPAFTFKSGGLNVLLYLQRTFLVAIYGQDLEKVRALAASEIAANLDTKAPTTRVVGAPEANKDGWYAVNVTFTVEADDGPDGSAVQRIDFKVAGPRSMSGTFGDKGAITISAEGQSTVTVSATDQAGNSEPARTTTVRVDRTPPRIVFTGNAGRYGIFDQVSITCSAEDKGSGLTTTTCEPLSANALSLGLGDHALTRTATDIAGNTTTVTSRFTVALAPELAAVPLILLVAIIGAVVLLRRRAARVVSPTTPPPAV